MLVKYSSSNQTKNDEMGSVCDTLESQERERDACGIFVGKPEGKRPLEKLGRHGTVIL